MDNNKTVYYFVSHNIVYNDKFIPIVLKLAEQGNYVNTIFFNNKIFLELKKNTPYYEWLKQFTSITVLQNAESKPVVTNYIVAALRYLTLIVRMTLAKRHVAFFDSKKTSKVLRIFSWIAKTRGNSVLYTPTYDDYYGEDFTEDGVDRKREKELFLKYTSEFLKLKSNYGERFTNPKLDQHNKDLMHHSDAVVIYHDDTTNRYESCGRYILIKYPKLNPWWKDFVNKYPPIFDNPRIQKEDRYVSVFLTHFGNYWFQDGLDLNDLLLDIIRAIRKVFPKILIVIKPKYTVDTTRLAAILDHVRDRNIVTTQAATTVLSHKSICGITTFQTTAQFEFLSDRAPWIEYGIYSDWWKEVYPPVTFTEEYGGIFVDTYSQLEETLKGIETKRFDLDSFKDRCAYRDKEINLDVFSCAENANT